MSGLALTEYDICLSRQEHGAGQVRERGDRQKTGVLPDPARPGATGPGRGCSRRSGRRPQGAVSASRHAPDHGTSPDSSVTARKDAERKAIWMSFPLYLQQRPCKRRISALVIVRLGSFLQTLAAHTVAGNSQYGRRVFSCCMGIHPGQLLRLFQPGKPFAKISIFLP